MSTPRLFEPFAGWLIEPEWAARVIAGAYDAKSPEERRAIVDANPYSYLGVTRSSEDLAPGDDADQAELLRRGASTLTTILDANAFAPTGHAALYAYRLTYAGHSQLGVVGALAVAGFHDGRVLTHENVRPNRARLLSGHLQEVGATSSPIALTHRPDPVVAAILAAASEREPAVHHIVEEVLHEVWVLDEHESVAVAELLADEPVYVTDGHHRSAAAIAGDEERTEEAFRRTLAVLFPSDALRVEAFHRRIPSSTGDEPGALEALLADAGELTEVGTLEEARPQEPREVGVYHRGSWWKLALPEPITESPVGRLDVELLRTSVIRDLLGVDELQPDSGADYVPAPNGIDEVVRRCDDDGLVGFVMYATSIEDLMAVADAKELMPPKSSYVAPKPRSGIFLRILGTGATAHLTPS
ncbi:MAG: DUF1015 family protein [Actinomycetota bacterium]